MPLYLGGIAGIIPTTNKGKEPCTTSKTKSRHTSKITWPFNEDYYIIGTYQATQWLGDRAFEVIGIIKDYEQANFGKVCTDLSSPEAVVNMYAFIVGELVVSNWFAGLEIGAA